jgi:hypothetical protein
MRSRLHPDRRTGRRHQLAITLAYLELEMWRAARQRELAAEIRALTRTMTKGGRP